MRNIMYIKLLALRSYFLDLLWLFKYMHITVTEQSHRNSKQTIFLSKGFFTVVYIYVAFNVNILQ